MKKNVSRGGLKIAIAVVVALSLSACSAKHRTDQFDPPPQSLSRLATGYVMLASDGVFGNKTYAGSGRTTSNEMLIAASVYLDHVDIASERMERSEALKQARANGAAYVFEPIIVHWEDRNTEWSGKPDRITIKMVVWDVETGDRLASTVARASSKWATFGGDHPQDLLPHLMKTFVGRLFASG